jgi:hypothetical protein
MSSFRPPHRRRQGFGREAVAEDGGMTEQDPVGLGEPVEPGPEEAGEGLGDGQPAQLAGQPVAAGGLGQAALVEEHPDRLDRVERNPFGPVTDRPDRSLGQAGDEAHEEQLHVVGLQGPEVQGGEVALARAPGRAPLEELRAGEGDDEDRPATSAGEERLDEVEEPRIGPVEVLEDDDRRRPVGEPLEDPPPSGVKLVRVPAGHRPEPEQPGESGPNPLALVGVGDQVRQGRPEPSQRSRRVVRLGDPEPAANHLGQRPERDSLAIRRRTALVPVDGLGEPVDVLLKLPGEAALADPADPGDRDEAWPALPGGGVKQLLEQSELVVASDERRLEPSRTPGPLPTGHDPPGEPRRDRESLALEQRLAGRLVGDRRFGRPEGRLADEDGSGGRRALEARGRVDEVTGDHALVGGTDRDRGLAGQDGRPGLDRGAERPDGIDELEAGPDSPLGVVLVGERRAPDRHDRIADELLDHVASKVEVAGQELAGVLGVSALGERREADEIGEQDRHEPALGDRRRARGRGARTGGG